MKGFIKKYGKTLALTILVVVAGCSYSCKDQGQGELLSVIETGQGNGETVETGLFADCMYLIPLDKGQNIIKMTYRLPGLTAGVIGTAIGILLTFGMFLEEKRRSKGMPTDYSPGQEW